MEEAEGKEDVAVIREPWRGWEEGLESTGRSGREVESFESSQPSSPALLTCSESPSCGLE